MSKARDIADSNLDNLTVDTNTLVIDSTNNRVGIGTSSPNRDLHVSGLATVENTAGNGAFLIYPDSAVNKIYSRAGNATSTSLPFAIHMGSTERIRIDNSGNVGIGTSSPSALLNAVDASGSGTATQIASGTAHSQTRFAARTDSYNGVMSLYDSGGTEDVRLSAKSGQASYINNGGNVGIGTSSPDRAIKIHKDNAYVWIADAAGGNVAFIGGGGENDGRMRLYDRTHTAKVDIQSEADSYFNGGNVGIGTSSPDMGIHLSSSGTNYLRVTNTTTGVGSDFGTSSTGTEIINRQNAPIRFQTNATERMRIDSSGNVGIGTSSPDANSKLHIKKTGADAKITIETDESNDCYINFSGATSEASIGYEPTSNAIVFANAADGLTSNERMRIDISGQLGLGTSPPSAYWGTNNNIGLFTPLGYLGSNGNYAVSLYSNGYRNSSGGFTYLGINGNTSTASGIDLQPDANIIFRAGTASATALPERMRITSSGNVGLGTSSPSKKLHVVGSSFFDTYSNSTGSWETRKRTNLSLSSFASGANPTYDWNSSIYSFKFSNYNNCLAITVGGSINNRQANIQVGHSSGDTYAQYYGSLYLNKLGGTVYANTSSISDERYKTNIVNIEEALNKVTSLNGYTFYRTDVNTDLQQAGVIAQQVQEVFPCAVVYDEDEDKYAVSYDMLSALYIEAFKELKTKVETLETENQEQATQISDLLNRVAALEAN